MKVSPGDEVYAEGYGPVVIGDVAELDTLVEIILPKDERAWTDRSLLRPLDN